MDDEELEKQPEAAADDADGYYEEDDGGLDDVDLSFLDDEEAEGREKHSA